MVLRLITYKELFTFRKLKIFSRDFKIAHSKNLLTFEKRTFFIELIFEVRVQNRSIKNVIIDKG